MIGNIIGAAMMILLIGGFVALCLLPGKGSEEEDHCLGWHRANGQWRVRYPDGQVSQPFTRKVAEGYKELFGGEVIPK